MLSQPPKVSPFASQRVYFVMTDRYRNGDPANDRGGRHRPRLADGLRPGQHRLLPRRRLQGPHRHLRRPVDGPRPDQGARLHRALGHPAGGAEDRPGRQRRLPRLLGPQLRPRRPAPRHRAGLQGLRRLRPLARAEGVPRRRRQPHRRRDHPCRARATSGRRTSPTATARGSRSSRRGTRAARPSRASPSSTCRGSRSCCRATARPRARPG